MKPERLIGSPKLNKYSIMLRSIDHVVDKRKIASVALVSGARAKMIHRRDHHNVNLMVHNFVG